MRPFLRHECGFVAGGQPRRLRSHPHTEHGELVVCVDVSQVHDGRLKRRRCQVNVRPELTDAEGKKTRRTLRGRFRILSTLLFSVSGIEGSSAPSDLGGGVFRCQSEQSWSTLAFIFLFFDIWKTETAEGSRASSLASANDSKLQELRGQRSGPDFRPCPAPSPERGLERNADGMSGLGETQVLELFQRRPRPDGAARSKSLI